MMTFSIIKIGQGSSKVHGAHRLPTTISAYVECSRSYNPDELLSADLHSPWCGRRVQGQSLRLQYGPSSAGHFATLPRQMSKSRLCRMLEGLASIHVVSLFRRVTRQESDHDDSI